jgi:alpha-mannosidase
MVRTHFCNTRSSVGLPAVLLWLAAIAFAGIEPRRVRSAETPADPVAQMAQWYKPGHFDGSTFYLIGSSHNDIAYLDDPGGTADFRAESLIGPGLDLMKIDNSYCLDIETTLYLKEFLQRYPERMAEVKQRVREGRLSFGGRYTQFYEAVFGGEALARQMVFGRKWLKKTLGDGCDTRIVWDTDIPQRTLQSPQVFAKAGIKYLMIGRFPAPGVFLWESPDGSSVMFHTYLYGSGWGVIPGRGAGSTATPADTVKYVFDLLESQRPYFQSHGIANFGSVTMSDYSCPGIGMVQTVQAFNKNMEALRKRGLSPPQMKLGTAETFLSSIEAARPRLQKYTQDWPNPWSYHHQPSHHRMVAQARRGYQDLVNAERFALVASLLDAEERPYPQERLNRGWEGLIYPDHGWCGEKTFETIRVFYERLRTVCEVGQEVYESSLQYIARRIRRAKQPGTALIVFNPLSWKRTSPATCVVRFDRGEAKSEGIRLADARGQAVPCQVRVDSRFDDGSLRDVALCFLAENVPPIGYKTYYLSLLAAPPPDSKGSGVVFDRDVSKMDSRLPENDSQPRLGARTDGLRGNVLENRFFRLELGERGVRSLVDKESGAEVFDTGKFLANEIFMLGVATTPTPYFEYTFYPDNRRTETLENLGRFSEPMKVELVASGDVKTVVAMAGSSPQFKVRQEIALYHQVRRIDFSTELDWAGGRKRELRLAFPIKAGTGSQVSYDVPFGVVEVGRNEMGSRMPREVQNWIDVSDGRRGATLAVGDICVHDLRDITTNPGAGPLIQPVLLCTLVDLESPGQKDHPWWTQPGRHRFDFAIATHPGTWQEGWRFGWEFNNPLAVVVARDLEAADARVDHYVTQDPPEKRTSSVRTHTYGSLPEESSFGSVEPPNVVLSTIKKCEDDGSIVVRCFDMEGKTSEANLRFFKPIASAEATNLIEEEGQPLAVSEGTLRIKSRPYSIDTVKLTLQVPQRRLLTLPHFDAMEYPDQADADSVWKKYPSYRALSVSDEQNHTPDGKKSLKSSGIMDFASVTLPAATNISVAAWLYDSGEPDTFGGVLAVPTVPTDPSGGAEFGIFPSARFGDHGGGSTHYTYYTGTGDWARQNSGIPRAKGWHKVEFRFTPAGGSIHFDDKLVTKSDNLRFARSLFLGNPWAGAKPMYFDDVSVTAIADPAPK